MHPHNGYYDRERAYRKGLQEGIEPGKVYKSHTAADNQRISVVGALRTFMHPALKHQGKERPHDIRQCDERKHIRRNGGKFTGYGGNSAAKESHPGKDKSLAHNPLRRLAFIALAGHPDEHNDREKDPCCLENAEPIIEIEYREEDNNNRIEPDEGVCDIRGDVFQGLYLHDGAKGE